MAVITCQCFGSTLAPTSSPDIRTRWFAYARRLEAMGECPRHGWKLRATKNQHRQPALDHHFSIHRRDRYTAVQICQHLLRRSLGQPVGRQRKCNCQHRKQFHLRHPLRSQQPHQCATKLLVHSSLERQRLRKYNSRFHGDSHRTSCHQSGDAKPRARLSPGNSSGHSQPFGHSFGKRAFLPALFHRWIRDFNSPVHGSRKSFCHGYPSRTSQQHHSFVSCFQLNTR